MRTTIRDIQKMKASGERIPMLTAYDYPSAKIAERAGVPILLVGDSLGQVVLGHGSTLPVSVDDMVRHSAAVVRATERALIVGDMPFLSYPDTATAIRTAGRLMQEAGVQAVKLEGGGPAAEIIAELVRLGIPVVGHLGFTPQSSFQIGVRVQAKTAEAARQLIADSEALQAAGAFLLVLELVPAELAAEISRRLTIPVIGIGAGAGTDGQVQVWHDVLGLFEEHPPRHARRFAEIGADMQRALESYVGEVKGRTFPTPPQASSIKPEVLAEALGGDGG